ncbi:MAG: GDSL-type esterase/lipase family protein [Clostridiaceae bacterium]|nr:GDSL-type esterase/lipase family protein [Clostridiaceae bacterium]
MKKSSAWFLCIALLFTLTVPAQAAYTVRNAAYAQTLWKYGLFLGDGRSFALDKPLTRAQGAVLLVRLLGKESELVSYPHPFTDVPDAYAPYVGYCYTRGYVTGLDATHYGSEDPLTAAQFLTLTLRALGYDSNRDFAWDTSADFAYQIGMIDRANHARLVSDAAFLRDDAVYILYQALITNIRGTNNALVQSVTLPGHPDGDVPAATDIEANEALALSAGYPDLYERRPVGDDFFSDAAFVGDSIMTAFEVYTKLTPPDYLAAVSMTLKGAWTKPAVSRPDGSSVTIVDALGERQYGKIYIELGLNEIGNSKETFRARYEELIVRIREIQPDADLYLMSPTPVGRYVVSYADIYTHKRIHEYAELIRSIAADNACWYVDLIDALADEDGYLPDEVSSDGIHFGRATYLKWADYLRTHYAGEVG